MTDGQVAIPVDADGFPIEEQLTAVTPINGRDVTIRQLSSTQIMQLQHEASVLQQDHVETARKRKSIERVYRVLRSAVVGEEDRDFVEDLMADGELDMRQLIRLVIEVHKNPNAPTKATVRRSRTPRRV